MGYSDQFFSALGKEIPDKQTYKYISQLTGIPINRLKYYNQKNIIPTGNDLDVICAEFGVSETYLQLKMGRIDLKTLDLIQKHADTIYEEIKIIDTKKNKEILYSFKPTLETNNGTLYNGDCIAVCNTIKNDSVDMVFSDPPFNLDKLYPSNINDSLKEEEYLKWTQEWIKECIRILKPGGSFFLWNLPIWNGKIINYLNGRLNFKHWIATDIKCSLPIQGRLYPSHYSLLYFVKGDKANTFNSDRLPAQLCPKCFGDLKDYGGYKHKMNPLGISLTDIWIDIPPVRHKKYKKRSGSNELNIKLLDRVIEMSTKEGDTIFDPFGGSGTTYIISEIKNRRWIGSEIDNCDIIKERFENIQDEIKYLNEIRGKLNSLFPEKVREERKKRGLWTVESAREDAENRINNKTSLLKEQLYDKDTQ